MIKNPSKTVIRVFLVPFDFRDMPTSSKTFIRQKVYKLATPSPALSPTSPTQRMPKSDNDRLRCAVHLQFNSTPTRKLYLTRTAKVVFSQRGADADEVLKVVNQEPTPKYTDM